MNSDEFYANSIMLGLALFIKKEQEKPSTLTQQLLVPLMYHTP